MPSIETSEGFRGSADGTRIYWRRFLPRTPRAALVFVHGLADHSGRFLAPALHFAERGYAAYALDYRGHGRSPGKRVHVSSFAEFRADVRAILGLAQEGHPGLARLLVGHSLGGLIALSLVLRDSPGPDGLVLSSPFLGLPPSLRPSAALAAAARLLSRLWPGLLFPNTIDPRLLCHDPGVVAAYVADPLVSHMVSARWYTATLATFAEVHAEAGSLATPTLVMYAGADGLVDPEATERWIAGAPASFVTAVRFERLYHELFNEPERDEVLRRLEAWLEAFIASHPPADATT